MTIEQLEGIANVSYQTVQTLTWESGTDWNNSVSEAGMVHEGTGDFPGDSIIQLGHPTTLNGLLHYYTFDESSGDLIDQIGSLDGTVNGTTRDVTGLYGTTSYSFNGSGDTVDIPNSQGTELTNNHTAVVFIKPDDFSTQFSRFWTFEGEYVLTLRHSGNGNEIQWVDGEYASSNPTISTSNLSGTGVWYMIAGRSNWGTETNLDVFGPGGTTSDTNTSPPSSPGSQTNDSGFGGLISHNDYYYGGDLDTAMFFNSYLSDSELADLWNNFQAGNLTTSTKTFSSSQQPDLSSLDYSLNGETASIDVIGSPGTADEEIVSQTLDGSTSYTLTWSNSHTDFRLKFNMDTSNVTTTPTLNSASLTA